MPQPNFEPSRSLVALDQPKTLIAVVELSLSTWLVGGIVPGIDRDPLKKLTTPELATKLTDPLVENSCLLEPIFSVRSLIYAAA
jgi:hypothetical protein